MVTTKQKPTVETQKVKRKEPKHTTTKKSLNYKGRQHKRKKGTKELQNSQKTTDKIPEVHPYLPIITLNVNGLNSPINRHRV